MDILEIWNKVLENLKGNVSPVGFNIHIKTAVPVFFENSTFTISVATSINKNLVEYRYKKYIESSLEKVTGAKISLAVLVGDADELKQEIESKQNLEYDDSEIISKDGLNPKYTFKNFVQGSSNLYAYTVAERVANHPGENNNPLFIYGNSGLGKTHLMQAIGNKIKSDNPSAKVIYVSSENFMNEFITSLREKTSDKFRSKYRAADALLVDDVQFLKDKEATQEEFFHTFNELSNYKKQIVLTSDRQPSELTTLTERLKTRFGQGLTIDVSIPDLETRVAILQQKALEHNKVIEKDALLYVAEHIRSSVRELEGALLRIISMSEFKECKITRDFAEEVLKNLLPKSESITPQKIIKKVSTYYKISESDITGKVKTKEIVIPRQIAMYLCRKILNMNDTNIGKEFGKDRTTVGHNIEKIESNIDTDSTIKADVNYILKDLNYNEG